ncbi:GatB/YqeY domain-containing protein [Syntrophomonas erecta]
MSLSDQLFSDMKKAMKQKEAGKVRLATIRMVRAAQKEVEIEKHRELADDELLEIIQRELKKRNEALIDYQKANRPSAVEQLLEEIRVLQEYLPEQLGEDEIRAIIRDVIDETGATSRKDLGKVMKSVMPKVKGRADGKLVSELVKETLQ